MTILDQNFKPEKYFEQICKYPHGSYHEKPLSDYIVEFAKQRNLEYKQYDNYNVIIKKKGSFGLEDKEPVMLQAHMDMVCEKSADSNHDFLNDPIDIYVEDGLIKARNTTLGGDDGLGVAYMLSILDENDLPHPPLECVFTVQEEVGCYGAEQLDFTYIKSKRMIGLDNMSFSSTDVTSSGSQKIKLHKNISKVECSDNFYSLKIQGLLGGHSAGFINVERANSIKLSARILNKLNNYSKINIASINGGDKDNAIPVYCETIFSSSLDYETINNYVKDTFNEYYEEFKDSDKDISATVELANKQNVLNDIDSEKLIKFLLILPHGFRHKSMVIDNLTVSSENLANIRMSENDITIRYFIRAALFSHLDEMADEITAICDLFGYTYKLEKKSPGWTYVKDSKMRNLLFSVFKDLTGEDMKEYPTHGGLETAFISYGIPGIDIVCLGADCKNYHTVRETLDLKTFRKGYELLKELLKRL